MSSTKTITINSLMTSSSSVKTTIMISLLLLSNIITHSHAVPSDHNFCGIGFQHASQSCEHPCPSGSLDECPSGMLCYFNTPCDIKQLDPNRPTKYPTRPPKLPTYSPLSISDPKRTFFCGKDWSDASSKCMVWCPNGDDSLCPFGQSCFGDTTCIKTDEPTNRPTKPQPTLSPSLRPTGPTGMPTVSLMIDQPSNHQFCGYEYNQAIQECSLATHCPNGPNDCPFPQSCWHGLTTCDVRDFTSFEYGGFLNRPSQKELAEGMGLIYPSDDPTDHFFCGVILEDINKRCDTKPCPDGTSSNCDFGQACYKQTVCDARIRSDYGVTQSPTIRPTRPPLPSGAKEYFNFCGEDWAQANTCKMQWCGDGSKCPNGQSCFAETECNMEDKLNGPPTMKPTDAPVTYMDDINFRFCGKTYLDAVAQCKPDSYCKSGKHDECPGGEYCWPGVSCNIKDMIEPTTSRPTVYRPPTLRPSRAPLPYDDPRNNRFCGRTWVDADSCSRGHCPSGSDEECGPGLTCWADTSCHAAEITRSPSKPPTLRPTSLEEPTSVPSEPPIPYDDPINTSFCGFSFDDAKTHCSVESHCPSKTHQDCPTGQYCWPGLPCNILEFTAPTGLPSQSPSQRQSDTPTVSPSSSPVVIATNPQAAVPLSLSPAKLSSSSPNNQSISQSPTSNQVSTTVTDSNNIQTQTNTNTNQWCGQSLFDATRNCGRKGYDCPDGSCDPGLLCFRISMQCGNDVSRPDSISSGSDSSNSSSSAPTTVDNVENTRSPTFRPTDSSKKSVYFPPMSDEPIPKSPNENIFRVQHIIESIRVALRNEIFVLVTRGGALIKSSLYTYEGFLPALLFYANAGVHDNFFYLGGEQSSDEQINLEVESGIANVALFIAKMMTDTIAYEKCTPDLLACGLPALDTLFETEQLRFMCPLSSDISGMECEEGSSVGCACTLGFLNQYIGTKSSPPGKYSGIDFCHAGNNQNVCNRSVKEGAELRWITAMTYWVLRVQRHEENGWVFLDELHKFVKDGMVDTDFLLAVADLSFLDTNPSSSRESMPTKQQFVGNFFKVMVKLSEGHSESQVAAPNPTTQQSMLPAPATAKPITLTTPSPTLRLSQLSSIDPSISPTSLASKVPVGSSPTMSPMKDFGNTITFGTKAPTPLLTVESGTGIEPACPTFCTVIVKIEECPSRDITVPFTVPFCSPAIGINELCRGNGYCGTSEMLDNCGKGRSIYRSIDCSAKTAESEDEDTVANGGATFGPTASSTPCSLCRPNEVEINAEIIFNGKQATCAVVQSFLQESVYAGQATCISAKNSLSAACCEAKEVTTTNNTEDPTIDQLPSSSPSLFSDETTQPTKRGSDLPWYIKYTQSAPRSSAGQSSYHFYTAVFVCILSFIQL